MTSEFKHEDLDDARAGAPRLEELERLHSVLSAEERDELLQRLLAAAPRGTPPFARSRTG